MSGPAPIGSLVARFQCVHIVAKKCYECGLEWDGNAFTAQPVGAPRLPGLCKGCLDKDETRVAELMRPRTQAAPVDTDLEPPRTVGSADDDVYPIDRKMLQTGER